MHISIKIAFFMTIFLIELIFAEYSAFGEAEAAKAPSVSENGGGTEGLMEARGGGKNEGSPDLELLDWSVGGRIFFLRGPITGPSIGGQIKAMKGFRSPAKKMRILINSFGGSLDAVRDILEIFKEKKAEGYEIECAVPSLAASAAAFVASGCDSLYLEQKSWMLWHSVRVVKEEALQKMAAEKGLPRLSQSDFVRAGVEVAIFEQFLINLSIEAFGFDRESFLRSLGEEMFLPAGELKKIAASARTRLKVKTVGLIALNERRYPLYYSPIAPEGDHLSETDEETRAMLVFLSRAPRQAASSSEALLIGKKILKGRSKIGVKTPSHEGNGVSPK